MRGQNVKRVVSVRVYFKIAPRHLFCIVVTSRDNKKDIAPEKPDFIGLFGVLRADFSRVKIVDVKRRFSLCKKTRNPGEG